MVISDKHRLYGELLCSFVNAKNSDEAGKVFMENARKAFIQDMNYYREYNLDPQDDKFSTLKDFKNDMIDNNKNLNEIQKTLIKDFIENHPSHLHYREYNGMASFRGLNGFYNIHYLGRPIVGYAPNQPFEDPNYESMEESEDGRSVTISGRGGRLSKEELKEFQGAWEDMGNGDKIFNNAFHKKIESICIKSNLSEKETERVINILDYYFNFIEPEHNYIGRITNDLRNVLDVLSGTKKFDGKVLGTLSKYESIHTAHNLRSSYIVANDNGSIKIHDYLPFDGGFSFVRDGCNISEDLEYYYDTTIAFCLFEFFREESNQKYLKKCLLCGDFFIAADTRRTKCYSSQCIKKYEREKKRKQRNDDPVKYV